MSPARIKYIGTALIAILILGLLSGCTQSPLPTPMVQRETVVVVATPEPEEPLPPDAKIILRVGTGDSGEGLDPHQEIITAFEDENPDILVQLEAVAGRDYYARLLTQIAARAAPDIIQIGDDAVPMFVSQGAFLPLDEFIDGEYPLDTGIYLPGVLEPGQWEGEQYLLPKDFSSLGVYYNKAIFDEFDVPYPEDGWTWDDLLETAQALTRDLNDDGRIDLWGIQLPAAWTTGFEYWVASAGGQLVSEDGTSFVGYMDSPETVRAVQFYADLYNEYRVAPPPADMSLFGGGNAEFDTGRAAMRIFGRWPQEGYRANPEIDLGIVSVPQDAQRANVLFWGGFGIYSGSANPEAAWRFLRFYAGQQGAEVWKDWALPTVVQVAEDSGLSDDPIEGVWLGELDHLAPRAYVYTEHWGEAADPALRQVLEAAIIDADADIEALLSQAAQQAQAALDEIRAQ